jgi:putative phage-type endonuclease
MKLISCKNREEWIAARLHGIGGSDCAAVMGMSPWRSALDVYMERVGLVPGVRQNEAMSWGTRLEGKILEAYAEQTGYELESGTNIIAQHDEHEWMLASFDATVKGQRKGAEAKNIGGRQAFATDDDGELIWGESGTDHVPLYYLMQCQYYLAVSGYESWDLAALIGGQELRIYTILPDAELQAEIIETVGSFWRDHVLAKVPPPCGVLSDLKKFVAARFPRNNGKMLQVDGTAVAIADNLKYARAELSIAEAEVERFEVQLKQIIADADGIEWAEDGEVQRITWKKSKDITAIDWKALAQACNPPADLVAKFTSPKPGTRRLVLPRGWTKQGDNE